MTVLRRLLIVVLLAALPLQGYAAAAMLYCHARDAGGAVQGPGAHDPGSDHESGMADAHHAHGGSAGAAAMTHASVADGSEADGMGSLLPAQSKPNCSVCSSMCVAAALVASTPDLSFLPDGRSPFAAVTSVFAGVVLDLPDPPPLATPL